MHIYMHIYACIYNGTHVHSNIDKYAHAHMHRPTHVVFMRLLNPGFLYYYYYYY